MNNGETGGYDDIIGLPHHVSPTRPRMTVAERAAQFSPFAALTGFDAAVAETVRLTERRVELDEDEMVRLNERLLAVRAALARGERPAVRVTWFVPDARKDGGSYASAVCTVKRLDAHSRRLLAADGMEIPIEDIVNIEAF